MTKQDYVDDYADYLCEHHSDDIRTKDQHIEAMNDGVYMEQFARHTLTEMSYVGKLGVAFEVTDEMVQAFVEAM